MNKIRDCDLISVVVPVYNVEKYLERCVKSIIEQTYMNLEIILVDDGSTDESGTICDRNAARDNRIKVIHQFNGGLSDARNKGISVASGKYICFVDSDDWLNKDAISRMHYLAYTSDADIVDFGYFICDDSSSEPFNYHREDCRIVDKEEALILLAEDIKIHSFTWSKFYKSELFSDIRFPKGETYEDIKTTYRLFLKASKIYFSNEILYFYYQRKGSITQPNDPVELIRGQNQANINKAFAAERIGKEMAELTSIMNRIQLENLLIAYNRTVYYEREMKSRILKRDEKMLKYKLSKIYPIVLFRNNRLGIKTKIRVTCLVLTPHFYNKVMVPIMTRKRKNFS